MYKAYYERVRVLWKPTHAGYGNAGGTSSILPIIPLIVGQQMKCFGLPLPHPPYPYEAPLCRVLSHGYMTETVRSLVTLCHIVQQPRAQISLSSQHGVCKVIYFLITDESCPRLWSTWSTSDLLNIYISVLCLVGKATEGWRQVQWPFHHFVCATRWHVLWGLLLVYDHFAMYICLFCVPPSHLHFLSPSLPCSLSLYLSLLFISPLPTP